MKAIWNNVVIADSDSTVIVENNHYFPKESIITEFFKESNTHTYCGWKGEASYYNIEVENKVNADAAWYYPKTKKAAQNIENMVAFWKGVKISE